MQGSVYQIAQHKYGNQPHLYVVVLEFSGNKDCLVVPAFSADGYMVNQVVRSRLAEGWRIDQIAVELDNAQHIQFATHHTGKPALWLISDVDRLPIAEVHRHTCVGHMTEDGLRKVCEGLLNFAPATSRMSANAIKKIRKFISVP